MNFELSEEHLMIRQAARDFAQNELKPGVIERCLLYTSPSPRDRTRYRMPSSA